MAVLGSELARDTLKAPAAATTTDLLRWPLIGAFLKRPWARVTLQVPLFLLAIILVLHGLFGPQLAPKNLATLLTWVHYRGLLVLVLLAAGNLFCMGCPLLLPRELIRRFVRPVRAFPRRLRSKWLAAGLFVGILYVYELFDLWSTPFWTAILILGYFVVALVVDALFERASFCKYVCPIGQFNFVASTVSPLEVRVRDAGVCGTCATKDCIRGRRDPDDRDKVVQRGCELNLYLPRKVGNLDCTFCMDCVHACPHDNVALGVRLPGEDLVPDTVRSGLGRLSKRRDIAALVTIFTFGALLNAFGMVSPVYAFQTWLAGVLGTRSESVVLGVLFGLALVVEPVVLLTLTGWSARRFGGARDRLLPHITRFAYSLVPLGCGIWAAHYAFHFFTGLWTFVPVAQSAALDMGWTFLGHPDWGRGGLSALAVQPIELGLLVLGLAGSIAMTVRLAALHLSSPKRGSIPWIALHLLLFATAVWLLSQPMEMRGTFL
jgi:hypothetical protein